MLRPCIPYELALGVVQGKHEPARKHTFGDAVAGAELLEELFGESPARAVLVSWVHLQLKSQRWVNHLWVFSLWLWWWRLLFRLWVSPPGRVLAGQSSPLL